MNGILKINNKQHAKAILLYGSTVFGLIISMLCSVLNTRSLPPSEYGDVRYIQNIIAFVSSVLLLGYFTSGSRLLALSNDEEYSRRIRGAMCFILGVTALILMLCMCVTFIYHYIHGESNIAYLALSSVPFCFNMLLLNYINTTAQGDGHIGRMAIARLLPSALYLIVGYIVFQCLGATSFLMLAIYNGSAVLVLSIVIFSSRPKFENLKESLKLLNEENKIYGFNVYIGSLAGVSTGYIAGIILGNLGSDNSDVGFFTLALTLASPLTLLPTIIGTTYFKSFATNAMISKKLLYGSIILTVLSGLLFVAVIKLVVNILYPEEYSIVSLYASWLALAMCAHGMGDLFNKFLGAHGQGKQLRNGAFICGTVLLLGSLIGIPSWGINAAITTRIVASFSYFISMFWFYYSFTSSKGCSNVKSINN